MELSRELLYPEVKSKVVGGVIPQEKRFESSQESYSSDLNYSPNYDFKYKKPTNIFIKKDVNREEARQKKKQRIMKMFPDLITSCKINLSMDTADTEAGYLGPGAYDLNWTGIEPSKTLSIPKADRFQAFKKDDKSPLAINYNQIEGKIHGGKISLQNPINEKIKKRRQEEAALEEARAREEIERAKKKKQEDLDLIVLKKRNPPEDATAGMKQRELTEKERLFQIFRIVSHFV